MREALDKSSGSPHGYVLVAQEFQHIHPPQPTRLQMIVATLCAIGSSTVQAAAGKSVFARNLSVNNIDSLQN
ncbi:hypothetical protein IFM47457_10972 [Aspergillus lentulus]|jgi:hypothetical protein|nr:hypothetical protein IFM47457_10972 [Aspergillus lentulus]